MNTDATFEKKELLLLQIESYERSGFFAEKEMDKLCAPIRLELEALQNGGESTLLMMIEASKKSSIEEFKDAFVKLISSFKKNGKRVNGRFNEILIPNKPKL